MAVFNKAIKKKRLNPILSNRDRSVLLFLWKHRISTFQALKEIFYPELSGEQTYFQLGRLRLGQYIKFERIEGTRNYVWCLEKRGFIYLTANCLPELKTKTYRPQSQIHDLLTTSALLGYWKKQCPTGVSIISEQEISSIDLSFLPVDLRKKMDHKPDGLWLIASANGPKAIALEMEISGKASDRYEQICASYSSQPFFKHVVWIVDNKALGKRILASSRLHGGNSSLHIFVERRDFEANEWDALILNESFGNKPIGQLLADMAGVSFQSQGRSGLNPGSTYTQPVPAGEPRSSFLRFSLNLGILNTLRNLNREKNC